MGGLSLQSGHALPQGRQTLLARQSPGPPARSTDENRRGFRAAQWDEALDFTARRLRELQEKYGKDSVAVYGGASLTTEKAYLMGKFARVGLGTRHIDYNGRLCMVSAGTAYKAALGVDRAPNPWNDISEARSPDGDRRQHRRMRADYYRLHLARTRQRRKTHRRRSAFHSDRAERRSVPAGRPGTDLALLMAMLHVIIRDGLTDQAFIEAHTTGFEKTAESVESWNPRRAG